MLDSPIISKMRQNYLTDERDVSKLFYNDRDVSTILSHMPRTCLEGWKDGLLVNDCKNHISEGLCPSRTSMTNKLPDSIAQQKLYGCWVPVLTVTVTKSV